LLGADVARAEAEALFFVVANEGLAAGIDNDDAAGLVKDGAAALLGFPACPSEVIHAARPRGRRTRSNRRKAWAGGGATGSGALTAGGA